MVYIPHKEKLQVVALDWDGTLVDSVPYKIAQNRALSQEFGKNLTTEEVRQEWNASQGFPDLLYRLTGSRDMDAVMAVVKRDYGNPAYAKRNFAFAKSALTALRAEGLKIAIVTNATREILEMDARELGFDLARDFDHTQTVDEWEYKKPDGRVLHPLIKKFGIAACELLYVGDELKDYYTAVDAGSNFTGVTTGMTSAQEFANEGAAYVDSLESVAVALRTATAK